MNRLVPIIFRTPVVDIAEISTQSMLENNSASEEVNYRVRANIDQSDEQLLRFATELYVEVVAEDEVIYQGNLTDLHSPVRTLRHSETEELKIAVSLPSGDTDKLKENLPSISIFVEYSS